MKRYAVVNQENKVENIIVWDEASQWAPPEGRFIVNVEETPCDIGWVHDNGQFTDPNPPVEE
jgi:hypothetical protein